MAQTHAPDGSPNIDTGIDTDIDLDADLLPSNGADELTVESVESDVPNARPAEWMARPPSGTKTYDYRLKGLDLGADLVTEAPPRAAQAKRASNRRARRRLYIQWTLVLIVVALVIAALRAFVVEPVTVNSNAMIPTLPSGTSVLVVKWSPLSGSTGRGDIVVFNEPRGSHCSAAGSESQHLIARVIGTPGQTIWSQRGRIYVNGKVLNETGWYNTAFGEVGSSTIPRTTVPPGGYYVLGDNRTDMCDSRAFGTVARSLVVGKVVATVLRNGHPYLHSI